MSQGDFADAFHLYAGAKGTLTYNELFECLQGLGFNVTDEELRPKAGSDNTNMSTFVSIANSMSKPSPEDDNDLYDALRTFDKTGTGRIPAKEFAHHAANMGKKFTEQEVAQVLLHSKDGAIDYEALHKTLVGKTSH